MKLTLHPEHDVLVVTVEEQRLDAAIATAFKDRVRDAISETSSRVRLDLSHVQFMDSSGLGAVIAIFKTLPQGRKLEIDGLSPNVERVFRLTRMDSILPLRHKLAAAPAGGRKA